MQFHHAHGFRGQIYESLGREAPLALEKWLAAGGEPVRMVIPAGREVVMGVRSRRQTFEAALRSAAVEQDGLTLLDGHVDSVVASGGRASGVVVDGEPIAADLVVDASGRASRVTRGLRPEPMTGGPCGIAYVDRVYRLRDGAEPGPLTAPIGWQANFDGYQVLVFPHEKGFFSVLFIRNTADPGLKGLREPPAFEAACRSIPGLATWTDPERSQPVTGVLPGGLLLNRYQGQTGHDGRLALPGLVFVGDAVCTTTPSFGRGVTTSLMQAEELLRTLDEHAPDLVAVGEAFDAWCLATMKPWVDDHVHMDESQRRRWAGEDVDVEQRLPSDLVLAAAAVDPVIGEASFPYLAMLSGPSSLDQIEPRARALYAGGWRPAYPPGPTRAELVGIVAAAGSA
jgi:2-polyprenyl-6-methoxyphenol hydroxylase-like FAD-dependent oxidoreductase